MNFPLTLTTDAGGVPIRWCNYRDVAYYYSKGLILWEYGTESYPIYGGYQQGIQSEIEIPSIIGVSGTPQGKVGYRVPHLKGKTLFRRDLRICAYCGKEFYESDLTIDHIKPQSKGGLTTWMNCVASCTSCNMRKGSRTPEEANMELLYVPYTPDKAEWLILMNKKIISDQMEFLKSMISNEKSRVFDNNI